MTMLIIFSLEREFYLKDFLIGLLTNTTNLVSETEQGAS